MSRDSRRDPDGPSRREFLRAAGAGSAALLLPGAGGLGDLLLRLTDRRGQEGAVRVGHVAPDSGPLAAMGRAASRGARLGAEDAGRLARLLDLEFELLERRASAPEASVEAAESLVEGGASAIVGGFDEASCAALSDAAERLEVPFLNVGVAADRFRDEACSAATFHVQASETMYLDAAVHWLARRSRQGIVNFHGSRQEKWRWYFVHEEGEKGRRFLGRAAGALSGIGGEPLGTTALSPGGEAAGAALREARDAGAWAVLAIARGDGLSRLAREHADMDADFDLVLPFGDHRRYLDAEWAPEAFWPSLWHSGLFRYGATQLNNRYSRRFDRPMGPQGWANWAAVKLLGDLLTSEAASEGATLATRLVEELAFDGYKTTPLSFRPWNHQMGQSMYVLHPSVGDTVTDPYQNIGRVPLSDADDQYVTAELVESLGGMGRTAREVDCSLASRGPARAASSD